MQREVVGSSRLDVSSTIASKEEPRISSHFRIKKVWLSEFSIWPAGVA